MAEDIVVKGRKKLEANAADDFMLQNMMRNSGGDDGGGFGGGSMGGGSMGGGRAIIPVPAPAPTRSMGPRITPTAINQPRSTLGSLTGTGAPKGYGVKLSTSFKKGGKVKKMAKGGSTASKRGDGCATKGKTKGRFV